MSKQLNPILRVANRYIAGFALGWLILAVACTPAAAPPPTPVAKPTTAPQPPTAAAPTAAPTAAAKPTTAPQPTTAPAAKPAAPADQVTFLTDFAAFGYISPFYAGIERGFFKDENIELTITPGQGSADTATKVGAGSAQFGLADTITTAVAIGKGAPITLVAAHWQRYVGGMAYIQGRKEIKSYKDLEGTKIGAVQGDAYMVILPELMRQVGANPDKYEVVSMGAANTTAALLAGQVDVTPVGAATFSSRALGVKDQGATLQLFVFADNGLDALGHGIIVNNDLLTRNRDLVQRFIRAYSKSVVWAQQGANVDSAVDAYIKSNAQQNRDGAKGDYLGTIPYQVDEKAAGFAGQFAFPMQKLQQTVALADKAYSLDVKPESVYTNDFVLALPEALRKGQLP